MIVDATKPVIAAAPFRIGGCSLIEVEGLTRYSDGRPAIVDVSFTVAREQALGLVGPDGSGKTTILRVLAGVLGPTSGRVAIAGHDVRTRSREARRRVGYLPEGTPLPDEMRVEPYLRTTCRLRGVAPGLRRARIDEALERCRLGDHRREVIGRLPDELRQRLGLAQAIVHDPDALVLDEPVADRELIEELGRGRAVVLSGRTVSEVGAVCGRVLVLEAGRVVADETPAGLSARPAWRCWWWSGATRPPPSATCRVSRGCRRWRSRNWATGPTASR
jgi:ABC-2 type transport system ATP-binding protein